MSSKHPIKKLTRSLALTTAVAVMPFAQQAFSEQGCPAGFIPDGNEKLADSGFTSYDDFNSDIPSKSALGIYPPDGNGTAFANTGIGLMTGDYTPGGVVSQVAFPGDGDIPGIPTWLAYNGNNDNSPTKIWEQQITGLTPNKDYAFTAYFSNALVPGEQAKDHVAPLVDFHVDGSKVNNDPIAVCDAGGGLDPADQSCTIEATEDLWNLFGVTINSGSGTTATLAIHDGQIKSNNGNDFAMTLVSFQECTPISVPLDSDVDGIPDNVDIDDDNDGILDTDEGAGDLDGDGIPNRLDLDSDNDGLPDILEALGTDANNDGRVDNFTDLNSDGYHDPLVSAPWAIPDTDGDGKRDFLDVDSDDDGIFDIAEAGMTDADNNGQVDNFTDSNNDGWDNNATAVLAAGALPDGNQDGIPDYRQVAEVEEEGEVITRIDGGVGAFGAPWLLTIFGAATRHRRRKQLAAAALCVTTAGVAQAEQGQFYLGGGLGASNLEPEVINLPLTVDDTSDIGYKLFLGYDILDWLSIEGFGSRLGSAGFSNNGSIDYDVFGGGLVANLPNNISGLSFLGKLGLADINNTGNNITFREVESNEIYAGLGAEYQFDNDFSLRGEYEYFDKDAQLLSLSLLKRFGGKKPMPAPPPPVAKPAPVVVPPPVPAPEPEVAIEKIKLNIEPIFFDTDSYQLRAEAEERLNRVADMMKTYTEVEVITIGHADSRASDDYNMVLSLNRAKAATQYLIAQGVDSSRLDFEARGEKYPVGDNTTEEGRAMNRRVDFAPTPNEVEKVQTK